MATSGQLTVHTSSRLLEGYFSNFSITEVHFEEIEVWLEKQFLCKKNINKIFEIYVKFVCSLYAVYMHFLCSLYVVYMQFQNLMHFVCSLYAVSMDSYALCM